MNIRKRDGASFFKILLNNSAEYIQLPSPFAKKYLENNSIKKLTIFLKTNYSDDLKWKVKYLNIKDEYFFIDGWPKFMKDNSLQNGDFLVFWLLRFPSKSKAIFQVFCYAPNGSLRHHPTAAATSSLDEDNDDYDDDDDDDESRKPASFDEHEINDDPRKKLQKSITRIIRKTYLHQVPLTMAFEKAARILRYGTVVVKNDEGKTWNVEVKNFGQARPYPYLTEKWRVFVEDNKVEIGDTCKITHVGNNEIQVHVVKNKGRTPPKKSRVN